MLLAAGIVAAVTVAGFVGWMSSGDPDAPGRVQAAALPSAAGTATPARSVPPAASKVSVPAGARALAASPARSAGRATPTPTPTGTMPAGPVVVPTNPGATPTAKPTTTTTPSASPPAPTGTRLTSPGGSVLADCGSGGAALSDPAPEPGFDVESFDAGPTVAAEIVFVDGLERYRMTVTCVAGIPTPVVLPL